MRLWDLLKVHLHSRVLPLRCNFATKLLLSWIFHAFSWSCMLSTSQQGVPRVSSHPTPTYLGARGYHAHRFPTQVPAMQHGTKCMHLRFLRGKNTPLRGCSCEECQNSTLDKTLEIVPTFLATARKWFAKHAGHFAASGFYSSQT